LLTSSPSLPDDQQLGDLYMQFVLPEKEEASV
jgi:hypothetical protein